MSVSFSGGNYNYSSATLASTATTNFTMMCWAYIVDTTAGGLFSNGSVESASESGYAFGHGSNQFDISGATDFLGLAAGVAWHDTNTSIGTGWHHLAVGRGASQYNFWIDGTLNAYHPTNNPNTPTGDTNIGSQYTSGGRSTNGRVCQVKMWDSLLTTDQVKNEMRSPQPVHNFSTLKLFLPLEQRDSTPSTFIDWVQKLSFSKTGSPTGAHHTHF